MRGAASPAGRPAATRFRSYAIALAYLWSVPLALLLMDRLGWQYDGDLGWWLVTAYVFPVLFLSEPLSGLVSIAALTAFYFAFLIGATALFCRSWLRARG